MSRAMLFRLALAGTVMIAGAATSARASSDRNPPDLSGEWRFDPSRSDHPGGPGGERGWSRGPRMGGRGGGGFPGGRMLRLPDLVRIEEGATYVRLADSTGTAIEEIATHGDDGDTTSLPPEVPRLIGQWKGDRLEVKHDNGRGGKITETYSLEDKGRTLVLKTKVEARRTFEFKRVYQRVDAS